MFASKSHGRKQHPAVWPSFLVLIGRRCSCCRSDSPTSTHSSIHAHLHNHKSLSGGRLLEDAGTLGSRPHKSTPPSYFEKETGGRGDGRKSPLHMKPEQIRRKKRLQLPLFYERVNLYVWTISWMC